MYENIIRESASAVHVILENIVYVTKCQKSKEHVQEHLSRNLELHVCSKLVYIGQYSGNPSMW